MVLTEAGCDAYQPFDRRIWSTWCWGYRILNAAVVGGGASACEVVTAISCGESEGKAAQTVAGLDALQLCDLCPPSAAERVRTSAGIVRPKHMQEVKVWVEDAAGGLQVAKADVWVIRTGIQANAPMRATLNKSMGATPERGCEECGLEAPRKVGGEVTHNTCNYVGYTKPATCLICSSDGEYVVQAQGWATGKVNALMQL